MNTTTAPSIFKFHSVDVRTATLENGEPLFCAKDVCQVLGYANDSDAVKKHCKIAGVVKRDLSSGGQMRELSFITEGNLYRLIVKSRKPEAEAFEAWVMDEVLPSIRKTGRYGIEEPPMERRMLLVERDGVTTVIDASDKSLVHVDRVHALRRDFKAMQEAMAEMSHRMRICFGDINASDLVEPLKVNLDQTLVGIVAQRRAA